MAAATGKEDPKGRLTRSATQDANLVGIKQQEDKIRFFGKPLDHLGKVVAPADLRERERHQNVVVWMATAQIRALRAAGTDVGRSVGPNDEVTG